MRADAFAGLVPVLHAYDHADVPAGEHIGLPSTDVVLVLTPVTPIDLSTPGTGRRRMLAGVAGLDDRPSTIHTGGAERGIFCAVSAPAVRRLFGVPAAALAGRCVELSDVLGEGIADRLIDRLVAAPDVATQAQVTRRFLSEQLGRAADDAIKPEVARAWRIVTATGGRARMSDVARDVGWSTRHLTTQFTAEFGVGPKTVSRIARFGRSFPLVRDGADLADAALRCGYSDQAHLTREWSALAGLPPTRWRRHDVFAKVQDGG